MHIFYTLSIALALVASIAAQSDQQPTAERRVAQSGNGEFFLCGSVVSPLHFLMEPWTQCPFQSVLPKTENVTHREEASEQVFEPESDLIVLWLKIYLRPPSVDRHPLKGLNASFATFVHAFTNLQQFLCTRNSNSHNFDCLSFTLVEHCVIGGPITV